MLQKEQLLRDIMAGLSGVDAEAVISALEKAGAGSAAVAAELSFEDIAGCGLPPAAARAYAKALRNQPKPEEKKEGMQVAGIGGSVIDFALALGNVAVLGDKQLLEMYHPLERPYVADELKKRCNGNPFIVFSDKPSYRVDVEKSCELLELLKQGVDIGAETVLDNGTMTELYAPGELPDAALGVCPVHMRHLIGLGQYCSDCKRGWKNVPDNMREFAFLQQKEVWGGEPPSGGDAQLMLMFAALADPVGEYWAQARMFKEKWDATGQVIVLKKPVQRR